HHVMIISTPDRNVKRILTRLEQSALDRLRGRLRLGWGGLDGSELTDAASAPVPRLHPQRLDGHPTLWAAEHGHRSPLRSASQRASPAARYMAVARCSARAASRCPASPGGSITGGTTSSSTGGGGGGGAVCRRGCRHAAVARGRNSHGSTHRHHAATAAATMPMPPGTASPQAITAAPRASGTADVPTP